MARPIWKGHISFGLVSMPVELHSAESRADVSFHLVDSRNAARVQYERVNSETGEEVPWDKIVKGYEYSDGSYVLLSDEEMDRANIEMTRTIEIDQFVDAAEIDIRYFEKPYIIVPGKGGEKGYVLLREAMSRQGAAGIATIVIRARQHLAAVMTSGDALILEMLRYPQELRDAADHNIPASSYRKYKVTDKEITLASQLVKGMSGSWKPTGYHDEYRDALMKLIERKIKSGKTEEIEDVEEDEPDDEPGTINFMDVLKRSVEHAGKAPKRAKKAPRKKAAKKASTKKKATRRGAKKKAG